ncbi:MAG: porin [Acidobacteriota bacterium]|nr:porin [Acidobacteriota bacterium]
MRIPLCLFALVASAWAADPDVSQPADTPDQAQSTPSNQTTPVPPDTAKTPDAVPPAPPPKYSGFVFSAMGDGYFSFNFNHPSSGANQLQNFNLAYGQPELNLAKFTIDKSDKVLGFHVDAGFGEAMRFIHAADPQPKGFRYIEQMYVIAKPNHTHGAEFDFGQFVTSAGAEVIETSTNWNYSRSLLFAWAIPYYHFGFRSTVPVTKTFTAGFQLVNAWNTLWGNNNLKNVGLTAALTKTKYTWTANYYVGPNHLGTSSGKRNLFDTTLLLTPNSKANFYINYDYARDNRIEGGHDAWYGIAGAAHFQLTKQISISPRAEYFNDTTGFSTGTKQKLKEGTITGEYKYNDHVLARLEFRHDASDQPFFDRGAQVARTKNMNTATIGLIMLLGPLK